MAERSRCVLTYRPSIHPSSHQRTSGECFYLPSLCLTASASDSPCASALTGEEKKIEYNSEDGELARIHVRVWDEKAYTVLKKVRNWRKFDRQRTRIELKVLAFA